jgi:S-formylglutathione hydrolase FrmB
MRGFIRAILTMALAAGLWSASSAVANADVEYLMVPSAAMGRDIPVAFQAGGPHAVVLLDAFNAAPDVSNWVTAGNAMNTFAGKGVSVAAPAGGAWSMYTNWELDGSRQWETFLADELPNWLAANKGLAPSGHGIVGAAQGGGQRDGVLDRRRAAVAKRPHRAPAGSPRGCSGTPRSDRCCRS